jgi:hypothetical protein
MVRAISTIITRKSETLIAYILLLGAIGFIVAIVTGVVR